MSSFQKYLSLWVLICMIVGTLIGQLFPIIPTLLAEAEVAHVSLPIAILIWVMIYPMMLHIDFESLRSIKEHPRGLLVTWAINWLIQPFSMYALAQLFFGYLFLPLVGSDLAEAYLAGAVLLGTAPCTAMVFVWSKLTRGNPSYTLVQVASNDIIVLLAYAPIVGALLHVSNISVPQDTLLVSVVLFVALPLLLGITTRHYLLRKGGISSFEAFCKRLEPTTTWGLLLTLILIFASQSATILANPLHIVLIAVPLLLQTCLVFAISVAVARKAKLPYDIACPSCMISASNFFELALAVAISLFGPSSPAALATTVGVLIEVPIMLAFTHILKRSKKLFAKATYK